MISLELLLKYEKEIENLNKEYVVTPSKNSIAINSGLVGEKKVSEILENYSNKTYRNVVVWNRKKTFTTEIDFFSIINGFLVLVEAKEWYGNLKRHFDPNKVFLSQLNLKGQFFKQERTSPVAAVGGFSNDLVDYLKNIFPIKKTQIRKIIVFTRDELLIKSDFIGKKFSMSP